MIEIEIKENNKLLVRILSAKRIDLPFILIIKLNK
jgi:hypothetical protein